MQIQGHFFKRKVVEPMNCDAQMLGPAVSFARRGVVGCPTVRQIAANSVCDIIETKMLINLSIDLRPICVGPSI